MSVLRSPLSEDESPRTKVDEDEIRLVWDRILDILLERVHHKSISLTELAHLTEELDILLRAVKGRSGVWGSVVDVAQQLLRRDVTIRDLRAELQYNESTIYRALGRLESAGFAIQLSDADVHRWAINRDRCPVLHRASRPA